MKGKTFYITLIALFCFYANCIAEPMRRYNITASDTQKFVWFRVAKVGTRSILNILENSGIPLSVNAYTVEYDPSQYKGYFKFAFVRNPWDRVVSCYFNKVVKKAYPNFAECFDKDFAYFVNFIAARDLKKADAHIRLQTKLIPMDEVDFIGRMENFDHDVSYVMKKIGITDFELPHKNSTKHEHYSHYYTPRTRAIIGKMYKADIEAFGYHFE